MPRRAPIRLGPERKPVASLDELRANGFDTPEAGPDGIDWSLVLRVLDLPQDEAKYFTLSNAIGFSKREIAEMLNWSPQYADSIRKKLGRRRLAIRTSIRDMFAEDYRGGSSTKLSFCRNLQNGPLWNLASAPLNPSFQRVMAAERPNVIQKNVLGKRPKTERLSGSK